MTVRIITIFLLVILASCSEKRSSWGIAQKYFPNQDLLKDGVVNKYYEHYKFFDGRPPQINIYYQGNFLDGNGNLIQKYFNPAYSIFISRTFKIDSGRQQLIEEKGYTGKDTIISKINSDDYINWADQNGLLSTDSQYPDGILKVELQQLRNADTLFLNYQSKAFKYKRQSVFNEGEIWEIKKSIVFSEGLGLIYGHSVNSESEVIQELVEQMPYSEFLKRSQNTVNRVGYIAPEQRLDNDDFKLCYGWDNLNDYYNSEPDGRYAKNKNGLVNDIKAQLDTSKLKNESGFLTFRFIVNCEGNAGYFTAEENDLEYQPKAFDIETKNHLFEILRSLNNWRPVIINDESRDAHYYVTFKLKDGEITDILP
ncbi:hypothetical protein [Fulvivirga sp.]|uniref:hypothetical protein n=1 Tax=Fulvivirga sp. TaxID=1931237 RepID=UPI0032EF30B9